MSRQNTIRQIREDHGEVLHAYHDSKGLLHIGVGILIDERAGGGITAFESAYLLTNRLERIDLELDKRIPWWRTLSDARQGVLVNIAHALGVDGLMKLRKMLALVKAGSYAEASVELLAKAWDLEEQPDRAHRLATQMRTDVWQFKLPPQGSLADP